MASDIIQLERDLTVWVATKLGMTIDNNIFRGGIPADAKGSKLAGVMINTRIPKVYPGLKDINCQVLGKFESRDDALTMLNTLNDAVPCYGETINDTTFVSIIPRGSGTPYKAGDDGKEKYFASFNFVIGIL